jgi:hypothetical protein
MTAFSLTLLTPPDVQALIDDLAEEGRTIFERECDDCGVKFIPKQAFPDPSLGDGGAQSVPKSLRTASRNHAGNVPPAGQSPCYKPLRATSRQLPPGRSISLVMKGSPVRVRASAYMAPS